MLFPAVCGCRAIPPYLDSWPYPGHFETFDRLESPLRSGRSSLTLYFSHEARVQLSIVPISAVKQNVWRPTYCLAFYPEYDYFALCVF